MFCSFKLYNIENTNDEKAAQALRLWREALQEKEKKKDTLAVMLFHGLAKYS